MSRRAWLTCLLLGALVGIGCAIVTGGTDGYQPYPPCSSASTCPDNSICCVDLSGASVTQVCRPTSEGCTHQLCAASNECAGVDCVLQTCSYQDASTDAFSACGLLVPSFCAAVGAGAAADAAPDAADASDAGSDAAPE